MGISTEEYDRQASAGRFRVLSLEDAAKCKVPGYEEPPEQFDFGYLLVEYRGDAPMRVVGCDRCEPEDALLVRDFYWVAKEMNMLAAESAPCPVPVVDSRICNCNEYKVDGNLPQHHAYYCPVFRKWAHPGEAAPSQEPSQATPWTITLYLVPQIAASDDDQLHCLFCGKGHNVEWETGYRPDGTGKLVGSGICERCRVRLKAFVPRGVIEPSQGQAPTQASEPEAPEPAGPPWSHRVTRALRSEPHEPEGQPTSAELIETVREMLGYNGVDDSRIVAASDALAELEKRIGGG